MAVMDYALFPGCSYDSTGIAYSKSTEYVAAKIGLKMTPIKDWCCCGTSAAKMTSDDLMYALPSRSLALSEQQMPGKDVITTCTGCYASLKAAAAHARESEENRKHVSDLIEMDYKAEAQVKSIMEVLVDPEMRDHIIAALKNSLGGMKLACYYGCAQVRPKGLTQFDDDENPTKLEDLMDAAGAKCVDWAFKTECCGASNHIVAPDAAKGVVERIFRNAAANGAEAIITSCPLCWLNLDMRESQINKKFGTNYNMPVYYFTELLAMAMGASAEEAGLNYHFWPAKEYATSKLVDLRVSEEAPAVKKEAANE